VLRKHIKACVSARTESIRVPSTYLSPDSFCSIGPFSQSEPLEDLYNSVPFLNELFDLGLVGGVFNGEPLEQPCEVQEDHLHCILDQLDP
jgi:hypothetical protein